ncbi:saccharopine reductase [Desulfosarcina alkanivorans]|jgi:saccharopine dehydrogenase-like NADP-dependent oxidoreductase|uniref:Saccharopine reductase n=1 Tax=Desulfosarcina alkanivorans TaxID=571177 RepID=A0A5K7YHZ2_9BACT|nr:saccharopine dehydrogenase C-terminal domain-containing protein [Desulfosarcina alkanivorans]BBO67710.1 saccharopine reductase [Desulfosarcina alkanivorans]
MNIVVLGAGLVGAPMAKDLAGDAGVRVTVADISDTALARLSGQDGIQTVKADLADQTALAGVMDGADIVVSAVPGFMGFATLKAIIEAGKDVVDIAFCPEDPLLLDAPAREKGVTAVVDCGVAPGMSNMLTGHCHSRLDRTDSAIIYVGGLPEIRRWPYEYKAVFSPIDVIEEYVRPAFYVENGTMVKRPALSDPEYIDFPGVGTLEAFNTDGLRSLVKTLEIPNMKEKTLRYPGHIEKMAVLRESGFFSTAPVEVNGAMIRPLDLTARLLFPMWQLKEGEVDITLMKIVVEGEKAGRRIRYTWDLFDRYDPATRVHSMARTTGYTATMAVRLIRDGHFSQKGVTPPERIGMVPECVAFILDGLARRGVEYRETVEKR